MTEHLTTLLVALARAHDRDPHYIATALTELADRDRTACGEIAPLSWATPGEAAQDRTDIAMELLWLTVPELLPEHARPTYMTSREARR